MEINKLNNKLDVIEVLVRTIYYHLVPEWQRTLHAQNVALNMVKQNKKTKQRTHHPVAGNLLLASRISKKNIQKDTRHRLVPNNTPERVKKTSWKKLQQDVKASIARFEEKLLELANKRAAEHLHNLNI